MACAQLLASKGFEPHDILILLRSDRNHAYSRPIADALANRDLPVALPGDDLLETEGARLVIALLRLCVDGTDSLAWRTVLRLRHNRLGVGAFEAVYQIAVSEGMRFGAALLTVAADPKRVPRFGQLIATDVMAVLTLIRTACPEAPKDPEAPLEPGERQERVRKAIDLIVTGALPPGEETERIREHLLGTATTWGAKSVGEVLADIEAATDSLEQVVQRGAINILTMHRAKGLTAKAVFIAVAEEQTIPGRQKGEDQIGDERRLLYVSLTRAKHFLCISYCGERVDQQKNLGAKPGVGQRTLCPFLRDAPLRAVPGARFLRELKLTYPARATSTTP